MSEVYQMGLWAMIFGTKEERAARRLEREKALAAEKENEAAEERRWKAEKTRAEQNEYIGRLMPDMLGRIERKPRNGNRTAEQDAFFPTIRRDDGKPSFQGSIAVTSRQCKE